MAFSLNPVFAGPRETINFDRSWQFALGDASSQTRDFGYATEYFNYWTKAASIHNEGPYSLSFDASKWGKEWKEVNLPHDWVVELPFAKEASHSHGYKTVGPTYPETSIGWYRKEFEVPAEDLGRSVAIRFDGVFHSSQVWVNGFYLGREDDGYVSSEYDITQYLNYGGKNVVAVRVDATQESGWFYEGAGIYRHVNLIKTGKVRVAPDGVFVTTDLSSDACRVRVHCDVHNGSLETVGTVELKCEVYDNRGVKVAEGWLPQYHTLFPEANVDVNCQMTITNAHLWSVDDPHLYTLVSTIIADGKVVDEVRTRFGARTIEFNPQKGFLLNGERVQIKGVNLHQDHAGVGSAISDDIYEYRLERLRSFGCNAIRSSHNPMAPAFLDLCDSLGFVVMDENRLMGVNEYHREHLERMIKRDRNHPSVVLWSVGNEEWGLEWNDFGRRLTAVMREFCHRIDPTRPMTVATSGGPAIEEPADVAGFNYIIQNDVDGQCEKYPQRCAVGSEETTGCGTRGQYFTDPTGARMPAINRGKQGPDSLYNCIERGWQFYHSRPHLGGLFYWTGFDYRGESNPLVYPATGSSFGILDYCGFYKDEAWYLKSWWTSEPVLHILPHWNLEGHEGETVSVWVYSNCDEVQLYANGKNLGRKKMPADGHLEWEAVYQPGSLKAVGYKNGKKTMTTVVRTTGAASQVDVKSFVRPQTAVLDLTLLDKRGDFAAVACNEIKVTVEGPAKVIGVGNGDSGWKEVEKTDCWKAFNGCAQCIIESLDGKLGRGEVKVTIEAEGCAARTINL